MRILILNWRDPKNPQSGGAEIVTHEHAKAWVKKGHSVTWFTSQFRNSLPEELLDGVQIIRRGTSLTVYLLAPFFYLSYRNKCDIVIDEIHGIPFFTPLYVKKPIIAFIHEVAGDIWDHMYPFPVNKIGKCIEGLYFQFYQKIPFWTDALSTNEDLTKFGIKKEHCIAIACPITNEILTNIPEKEKCLTYIFVSRLVKMKGIEEIIKAFAFIHIEDKNAQLWIVGRGDTAYVAKLKDIVKQYHIEKQVTFFGAVSQEKKVELLRRAHSILHASIKEGWGLVIIEAASQATPAVVYNVCGLKDSVKDGKTGIVLSKNSPEDMAKQALLLIRDKKKYTIFQKNCLAWAKSLTWDKVTEESMALVKKAYDKSKQL